MSTDQNSEKAEAWGWSLRVLQTAGKSCYEMRDKLKRKGYSENVVNEIIKQLQEVGFLNDKLFANSIFRRFTDSKPSGKAKIIFELKRRKIPKDLIEEVLQKNIEEQEAERAVEVAKRKWMSLGDRLEAFKKQKRVFDFLVRRGFSFQMSNDAIRSIKRLEDNIESEEYES